MLNFDRHVSFWGGGLGEERRGEEMMFWCLRGICFYGEIIFLRNNKFYFLF
jgi:hypothetical protein